MKDVSFGDNMGLWLVVRFKCFYWNVVGFQLRGGGCHKAAENSTHVCLASDNTDEYSYPFLVCNVSFASRYVSHPDMPSVVRGKPILARNQVGIPVLL